MNTLAYYTLNSIITSHKYNDFFIRVDFGVENLLAENNRNYDIPYDSLQKNQNTLVLPQSRKHVWGRLVALANLQMQVFVFHCAHQSYRTNKCIKG